MRIYIPTLMKHRASLLGDVGTAWLKNLSSQLSDIEKSWDLKLIKQLSGGTESLVFLCEASNGQAVLKLGIPGNLARELETLQLAEGRGYATLLNCDASQDVILLEHLGRPLAATPLRVDQEIEVLCNTLKVAWHQIDAENGLMSGAEKAKEQADYVLTHWEQLDRPCPREVIDLAIEYASEREAAHDPRSSCLVHGDAHIWNTLQAGDSPTDFKFVDPDGLFAEPSVDLAISLREWHDELLDGDALENGQRRCDLLSKLTGSPREAIWQWGFIEHVSCGLLDLHLQNTDAARKHFEIVEKWVQG